jgi:hypothetical protein
MIRIRLTAEDLERLLRGQVVLRGPDGLPVEQIFDDVAVQLRIEPREAGRFLSDHAIGFERSGGADAEGEWEDAEGPGVLDASPSTDATV